MFSKLNEKKWGIFHVFYAIYLLFFCKDEEDEEKDIFEDEIK
ncbi:MAG: hypothetical protein ACRCZO_13755 [Cetobacterium sp.]